MKNIGVFLSLLILSGVGGGQTSDRKLVDGYWLAEDQIALRFNVPEKKKKSHKVEIKREFQNADEERLLNVAESLYPNAENLHKNCAAHFKNKERKQGDDWSCGSFDGVLTPFAVTKDTVNYYLGVSSSFRKNNYKISNGIKMSRSSLSYSAKVAKQEKYSAEDAEFSNVYVVSMELSWNQYCGSLCAMWVSGKRVVVFDKAGNVIHVSGDASPAVVVS